MAVANGAPAQRPRRAAAAAANQAMDAQDEREAIMCGGHRGEPSRGAVRRALVETWTSPRCPTVAAQSLRRKVSDEGERAAKVNLV